MKILSAQTDLGNATNVSNASVVRVFNSDSSNLLVTRKTSGGTTIGSFMVPTGKVVYCEKDYTDTLESSSAVKASKTAFSPMMSFALMTAADPDPTYTVSVSSTSIDEGGSFTTTISTTNVDDGTNLYWELSGTNITSGDFSSGALTGTASISSNSATFSHTLSEDATTEGTETILVKVYSDSGRNTQVGNTLNVTVADTSTTPPPTPGSTSFDGSNDYLYVGGNGARHAMADFGTGAYTIECWLKTTKGNQWIFYNADNHSGVRIAFGNNAGGGNSGQIEINEQSNNGDQQTRTPGTYNDGNWHHVAFSRPDGGKVKIFIDGDEKAEGQDSGRNLSATAVTGFFTGRRGSGGDHFQGNIYGIRVIKGQAIYTSNFSVPTSAPTTTSQGADASKVTLLCATTDDVDASVVSPEASNTLQAFGVTSSSDTPFLGGAVDFNGGGYNSGGESLAISSDSSLDLGSGSFTIEAWVKMDSSQGTSWNVLACSSGYLFGSGVRSWNIYVYGTTGLRIYDSSGGPGENWTMVYGNDSLFNNSSWTHIAWTRSANGNNTTNNNNTVWINGVGQGSFSNRDNSYSDGQELYIGSSDYSQNGNKDEYGFDGAISNFRFTKGQVLYTSNFTPSTSSLTTTSQGATASNVSVLGLQSSTTVTAFAKSPSTPTITGTPTVTTGPF